MIGLLASVIGLFAGLGLAIGLNELFVALNLDLPQTDTVFATRTIVVSLLVGTLVTLAAGLSPALRATRVPPIAAVREGAKLPRSALSRYSPHIAAVTVVIAVARALVRAARGRRRDGHAVPPARRRRARAVRRRRAALVAPRRPARPHRRAAGAPDGRRGRQARRGQRDARPRAHRLDRGRADDRHRARDVRRRARAGPARVQQRRDRAADPGRPRRHLAGRLHGVPGGGRRRGRRARRHRARQQRAPGRRGDRRQGGQPDRARREHDQRRLRLPLDGRLRPGPGVAGRRRRGPARRRRRGQGPGGRRLVHRAEHRQRAAGLRRPRDLRREPVLSAARDRERLAGGLRRRSTSGRATASR